MLTQIRKKLTDDKIDCVLEKGNNNEKFQYYLTSLCRKNLNRIIPAQLNVSAIRNNFDLLAKGIKRKVDVLMTSETKINELLHLCNSMLKDLHLLKGLIETVMGWYSCIYFRENISSKLIEMNSSVKSIFTELNL